MCELDVAACERIDYAALLDAARAASATLTTVRLREVSCATIARMQPYVIVYPVQLRALREAAPRLHDVRTATFTVRYLQHQQAQSLLARSLDGVPSLRIETLLLDIAAALYSQNFTARTLQDHLEAKVWLCNFIIGLLLRCDAARDTACLVVCVPAVLDEMLSVERANHGQHTAKKARARRCRWVRCCANGCARSTSLPAGAW